jgi:hypothetical protein
MPGSSIWHNSRSCSQYLILSANLKTNRTGQNREEEKKKKTFRKHYD